MKGNNSLGGYQAGKRDYNRALINQWFKNNPNGTMKQCAADLGLSYQAVTRHIRAMGYKANGKTVGLERKSRLFHLEHVE